jgi:hypothetical protein
MEVGFSVMRRDNIWVLKVKDSCTEGTFGTLAAAMRCAYTLANGLDGSTTGDAALAGCGQE